MDGTLVPAVDIETSASRGGEQCGFVRRPKRVTEQDDVGFGRDGPQREAGLGQSLADPARVRAPGVHKTRPHAQLLQARPRGPLAGDPDIAAAKAAASAKVKGLVDEAPLAEFEVQSFPEQFAAGAGEAAVDRPLSGEQQLRGAPRGQCPPGNLPVHLRQKLPGIYGQHAPLSGRVGFSPPGTVDGGIAEPPERDPLPGRAQGMGAVLDDARTDPARLGQEFMEATRHAEGVLEDHRFERAGPLGGERLGVDAGMLVYVEVNRRRP